MQAILDETLVLDETVWSADNGLPPLTDDEEDMPISEARVATIEERLNWTIRIGWGAVTVFVGAFIWLLTFYIPLQETNTQTAIKADTASQLEPIKLQLATITGLLQLKETKSVSEAVRIGVDFSQPKYALAAVKAIAEQAQADGIRSSPLVLVSLNDKISETAHSQPDLLSAAWSARMALVDYRSSLNFQTTVQVPHTLVKPPLFPGMTSVTGSVIDNSHITLDGKYWGDVIFSDSQIDYDGGPLVLQNVKFIRCRFHFKYNDKAEKFAGMVLAQNSVTGSVG